jgi:hypothetical protein
MQTRTMQAMVKALLSEANSVACRSCGPYQDAWQDVVSALIMTEVKVERLVEIAKMGKRLGKSS